MHTLNNILDKIDSKNFNQLYQSLGALSIVASANTSDKDTLTSFYNLAVDYFNPLYSLNENIVRKASPNSSLDAVQRYMLAKRVTPFLKKKCAYYKNELENFIKVDNHFNGKVDRVAYIDGFGRVGIRGSRKYIFNPVSGKITNSYISRIADSKDAAGFLLSIIDEKGGIPLAEFLKFAKEHENAKDNEIAEDIKYLIPSKYRSAFLSEWGNNKNDDYKWIVDAVHNIWEQNKDFYKEDVKLSDADKETFKLLESYIFDINESENLKSYLETIKKDGTVPEDTIEVLQMLLPEGTSDSHKVNQEVAKQFFNELKTVTDQRAINTKDREEQEALDAFLNKSESEQKDAIDQIQNLVTKENTQQKEEIVNPEVVEKVKEGIGDSKEDFESLVKGFIALLKGLDEKGLKTFYNEFLKALSSNPTDNKEKSNIEQPEAKEEVSDKPTKQEPDEKVETEETQKQEIKPENLKQEETTKEPEQGWLFDKETLEVNPELQQENTDEDSEKSETEDLKQWYEKYTQPFVGHACVDCENINKKADSEKTLDNNDNIIYNNNMKETSLDTDLSKTSKVVKEDGKYIAKSEKGKNFGTYDTKEEAEKRVQQMEMFKHMKNKKSALDNFIMVDASEADNIKVIANGEVIRTCKSIEAAFEDIAKEAQNSDDGALQAVQQQTGEEASLLNYKIFGLPVYKSGNEEYAVATDENQIYNAVVQEVESLLDDVGYDAFLWDNMGGIEKFLTTDWFSEAKQEYEDYYKSENPEEEFNPSDEDPVKWYIDNFGKDSIKNLVKEKKIKFDTHKIADEVLNLDGAGHVLSIYDGNEVAQDVNGKTYFLYRQASGKNKLSKKATPTVPYADGNDIVYEGNKYNITLTVSPIAPENVGDGVAYYSIKGRSGKGARGGVVGQCLVVANNDGYALRQLNSFPEELEPTHLTEDDLMEAYSVIQKDYELRTADINRTSKCEKDINKKADQELKQFDMKQELDGQKGFEQTTEQFKDVSIPEEEEDTSEVSEVLDAEAPKKEPKDSFSATELGNNLAFIQQNKPEDFKVIMDNLKKLMVGDEKKIYDFLENWATLKFQDFTKATRMDPNFERHSQYQDQLKKKVLPLLKDMNEYKSAIEEKVSSEKGDVKASMKGNIKVKADKYLSKSKKQNEEDYDLLLNKTITEENNKELFDQLVNQIIEKGMGYWLLKNNILTEESDKELFNKAVDKAIEKGYGYWLLKNNIITEEKNKERFDQLFNRAVERGRGLNLLTDKIITEESNKELFDKLVNKFIKERGSFNLLKNNIITRENNKELFDQLVNQAIKDRYGREVLLYEFITKEDGELFYELVYQAIKHGDGYMLLVCKDITREDGGWFDLAVNQVIKEGKEYDLLDDKIITREDGELFDKAVNKVIEDGQDDTLLKNNILTEDELNEYKRQLNNSEEQVSAPETQTVAIEEDNNPEGN